MKTNTALLVIDMQNDFLLPGRPLCVDGAMPTVPQIKKLLDYARNNVSVNYHSKLTLTNLQHFLLELGTGFCFESRQKLMRYKDDDFYVDLVFYHSVLKYHVLIDLKLGKLTHGDVGQMDSYIRMFDGSTNEMTITL